MINNKFNEEIKTLKIEDVKKNDVLLYDEEAERAFLSCLILDASLFILFSKQIKEQDFFSSFNKKLWFFIKKTIQEQNTIDLILLLSTSKKFLSEFYFLAFKEKVEDIISIFVLIINVHKYFNTIKSLSIKRSILKLGHTIIHQTTYQKKMNVNEIIGNIEKKILAISSNYNRKSVFSLGEILEQELDRFKIINEKKENIFENEGIKTGFKDLDKILNCLFNSEITILASRPGEGKTTLSLNIALNVCYFQKKTVLFFTIEMSINNIVRKILSITSGIAFNILRTGILNKHQFLLIKDAIKKLKNLNFFIADTPNITFSEIKVLVREVQLKHGIDFIIIDYLQLIKTVNYKMQVHNAVAEICRSIKQFSREIQKPFLVLSQLSRALEFSSNKQPKLWHLRSSGGIEENFDNVLFLYRDQEKTMLPSLNDRVKVSVSKHRNGPTGLIDLNFNRSIGLFSDINDNLDINF